MNSNRKKKRCELSREILGEYAKRTSIHGIPFIGDTYRPHCERIWWLIAFVASLLFCAVFIKNILDKLYRTPVIVSFAEKAVSTLEIPIPAMTLCPQNKFQRSVLNVSKAIELARNGTHLNTTESDIMGQVCPDLFSLELMKFPEIVTYNIEEMLLKLAPYFNSTFLKCFVKNDYAVVDCASIFRPTFTSGGLCFTFNGVMPQDLYRNETVYTPFTNRLGNLTWTEEGGYTASFMERNYPQNMIGGTFGRILGLVLSEYPYDIEPLCELFQGFKLFLHSPSDVPIQKEQFIKIPSNSDVRVSFEPHVIRISPELRTHSPDTRGCVFTSERYLRFFKIYTEENCWLECVTNFTLNKCGCVLFYMPHNRTTDICGTSKLNCCNSARGDMIDNVIFDKDGDDQCGCMPTCVSITYTGQSSQSIEESAQVFYKQYEGVNSQLNNETEIRPILFQVFFNQNEFLPIKRQELFSKTDLVASCGGILGLFMGVSVLSFCEIIYYCFVRPSGIVLVKRRQRQRRHVKALTAKHNEPVHKRPFIF